MGLSIHEVTETWDDNYSAGMCSFNNLARIRKAMGTKAWKEMIVLVDEADAMIESPIAAV